MSTRLDRERLAELGEREYGELKRVYCRLRDLKEAIDLMHDDFVREAKPPVFESVENIHLLVDDIHADLERFLLPVCDPGSAVGPVEGDGEDDLVCPIR